MAVDEMLSFLSISHLRKTAIRFQNQTISLGELNARADQIANRTLGFEFGTGDHRAKSVEFVKELPIKNCKGRYGEKDFRSCNRLG